ncbi:hypothetical protein [Rhizobium herbae]|nr:hypothetical protein [Rhizobium herbae]
MRFWNHEVLQERRAVLDLSSLC